MTLTERGLLVDETLRQERIVALGERASQLKSEALPLVEPLRPKLKRSDLIWKERVCSSCHNGKKKRLSCGACGGAGKAESFAFNLGSQQQLADVLYNGLGLPERRNGGRVTVDEEALQSLAALDKSDLVQLALRFAKCATMKEIYERLQPSADGRVRSVFSPAGTLTGRFSSSGAFYISGSTNLQNLPEFEGQRDPLFEVRQLVIPQDNCLLLYADLSQAEARVTACLSQDEDLLKCWQDPSWDIHRWTAAAIFGCAEAAVTPTQRFLGKVARHALNYGMGPQRFWRHVNGASDLTGIAVTQAEAKRIHAAYHALHPELKAWWARVESRLWRGEPIETCFGRKANFFPALECPNCKTRGALRSCWSCGGDTKPDHDSLSAAIAYEPQSTVADLCNSGLLAALGEEPRLGYRVLLQVHDALLVEAPAGAWRSCAQTLKRCLERPLKVNGYDLHIPAEVKMGKNWARMEKAA